MTNDPDLDALNARAGHALPAPPIPAGPTVTVAAKGLTAPQVAIAAEFIAMEELAKHLAAHHGASFCDAFAALNGLSSNLASMLSSAEGCAALGFAASLSLARANPEPFVPTVH